MTHKIHYVKISQTLFTLINDGKMNFIVVPVESKFKLSDNLWLIEMHSVENIPTGSIIVCVIMNEIYLDRFQFLSNGWKILGFDVIIKDIVRTDVTDLIANDIMMKY